MGRITLITIAVLSCLGLCTGVAMADTTGVFAQLSQSEHFDLSLVTILFIVLMGYGWTKQPKKLK